VPDLLESSRFRGRSRKKKPAVTLTGPRIVTIRRAPAPSATEAQGPEVLAGTADNFSGVPKLSSIVTAKNPRRNRFGDVPDMTPEEHERRGDAAVALFREVVRRATTSDRPAAGQKGEGDDASDPQRTDQAACNGHEQLRGDK
jgi:hypothetical protein